MNAFFISEQIAKASTIHKDFYCSPHFWNQARESIFSQTWQWLGTDFPLKEKKAGHCFPVTLLEDFLDEPLIITTDEQFNHYCLSNVCTHRGALLVKTPCQGANIRCPYHGRLFNLNGQFRSMPEFREVENFPTEADNLKHLPLRHYAGSMFTNLSGNTDFDAFFGPMMERLSWLPVETFQFRPDLSNDYYVNAHWALYCENYLEGFHIPFVHPALNQALDFGNYSTACYQNSSLQLGIAKAEEDCFDLPESSPDFGKKVAAYYYFVFPNLMFNFYPWGLSLNVVQPLTPEKTKVRFLTFVWKPEKLQAGAGGDVHTTELEDEEIVESVQKGIRSRFYSRGRYSVKHETGTHHFHRLIARFMSA